MNRPRYCKPSDRANERSVLAKLGEIYTTQFPADKWEVKHAPEASDFDGIVFRNGQPFKLVEIKNRSGSGERFATWHIAVDKIERCKAAAARHNAGFLLLFAWDGELFAIDGKSIPAPNEQNVQVGGRSDRGDAFDQEPMLHIPCTLFRKI